MRIFFPTHPPSAWKVTKLSHMKYEFLGQRFSGSAMGKSWSRSYCGCSTARDQDGQAGSCARGTTTFFTSIGMTCFMEEGGNILLEGLHRLWGWPGHGPTQQHSRDDDLLATNLSSIHVFLQLLGYTWVPEVLVRTSDRWGNVAFLEACQPFKFPTVENSSMMWSLSHSWWASQLYALVGLGEGLPFSFPFHSFWVPNPPFERKLPHSALTLKLQNSFSLHMSLAFFELLPQ